MSKTLTAQAPGAPPSPPARQLAPPRWTDRRLLVGVALVLLSVVGVVRVVAAADQTVEVWSVTEDLAAGVTLTASDVELTAVTVVSAQPYFAAGSTPVGGVVTKSVVAGELLPRSAVATSESESDLRWVTVPVERHHLPADLRRGEQVDVYLVERTGSGEPVGDPQVVLTAATVAEVDDGDSRFGGSSLELGISLLVPGDDVATLVAAEARGALTLVRVPLDGA